MAIDAGVNISDVLVVLPSSVADNLGGIILFLKAIGAVFIVYVIYLIVRMIIGWKTSNRVKKIEKKVDSIDKKLDRLLKDKKKKK